MASDAKISADEARAMRAAATPGPWSTYDIMGPRSTSGVCTDAHGADGRPVVIARGMTAADARLCERAPALADTVIALHAEVARLTAALVAATSPDAPRCDECSALAMRRHRDGGYSCDAHAVCGCEPVCVGPCAAWSDLLHAATVRTARAR